MADLKQMALDEYNSPVTTAHHGICAGGAFWGPQTYAPSERIAGRPFWNGYATQFMFNPCFEFTPLHDCMRYRFTATDCNQKQHIFEAESPMALLTPIWGDLPEGYVELKVEALEPDGTPISLVGARTFYRSAPYAGPDAYPPKACSYRECAYKALRYSYEMPQVQYWLKHGVPDPSYDLNVYPSKMIASIIKTMLAYASMDPERAENAVQIAKNAADYMLSITIGDDSPLSGLPPTYYTGFREITEDTDNATADELSHTVMMFYPAGVGSQYLALEAVTGDQRYFEAAKRIAEYYRKNVLESGTWNLVVSIATGESLSPNESSPDEIIPFLESMYKRTNEPVWNELVQNAHAYRVRSKMDTYHWEAQFEDSPVSLHYSNMTHFPADTMIIYIAQHQADDPEAIAQAEDLMRFVEDQFVVWGKHAPRIRKSSIPMLQDKDSWVSPAAMEQYNWYVPIDSSTSCVMGTFLNLYKATKNPLLLAKACTLADTVTRMQNPETGLIPTHWVEKDCRESGGSFWINCHNETALWMMTIANELE